MADRLRGLGAARLARKNDAGRSPSDLAHELSQRLADLAGAFQHIPQPTHARSLDLALDTVGCPGPPDEVARHVMHLTERFAGGRLDQAAPAHLALAAAFARQVAI